MESNQERKQSIDDLLDGYIAKANALEQKAEEIRKRITAFKEKVQTLGRDKLTDQDKKELESLGYELSWNKALAICLQYNSERLL